MSVQLISIAAVSENGVIGNGQALPWHYPVDFEHYKQTTHGHPIIMGRRTYETIAPEHNDYLPGRTNIVLTSQKLDTPDEVVIVHSINEAIEAANEYADQSAYVIGGQTIYDQFMPYVDQLLLTHIPGEYEGDTYFPEWSDNNWNEVDRWSLTDELDVVVYEP